MCRGKNISYSQSDILMHLHSATSSLLKQQELCLQMLLHFLHKTKTSNTFKMYRRASHKLSKVIPKWGKKFGPHWNEVLVGLKR